MDKQKRRKENRKKRRKSKCLRGSRRNYCNYFVVITFILSVIKNECETNPTNLRTCSEWAH